MATPAPAALPVSCKDIWIPQNTEAICWWLSINLALFHKERPELNARFDRLGNGNRLDPIVAVFNELYQHYSGQTPSPATVDEPNRVDLLTKRSRDEIAREAARLAATPAAVATPAPKPAAGTKNLGFQINSDTYQAASEYLGKMVEWLADDTDKLQTVFIPIINANSDGLNFEYEYDIYLHRKFFGLLEHREEGTKLNATSSLKLFYEFYQIPSTRQTLVLSFERQMFGGKYGNYTINPLEFLTLPTAVYPTAATPAAAVAGATPAVAAGVVLAPDVYMHPPGLPTIFDPTDKDLSFEKAKEQAKKRLLEFNKTLPVDTSQFELDAMTVSTPGGGHFVTYIKCNDTWIYDNGLSQGPLSTKTGSKTFNSFKEMMDSEGDTIRQNVVLMYYSKVP